MLSYSEPVFSFLTGRISKFAALILFSLLLSACTLSPVYSTAEQTNATFNLQFESANSRLEQIVYSNLSASFPVSAVAEANLVKVVVTSSNINPGTGSVALKGVITVTNMSTGEILFFGSRTASATFVSSPQLLANQQAANEASERAARELAQTIRLTLIGVLSTPTT